MIETRLYLKALKIVNAYHEQIRKEALEVGHIQQIKIGKAYQNLENVQPYDSVECTTVHSSSRKHLTKGKEYEVTRVEYSRFEIVTDSGKKKWYNNTNQHFKLL